MRLSSLEVVHVVAAAHGRRSVLLWNVRHHGFRGQDHGCNAGSVLQGSAADLGRVDDTPLQHVAPNAGVGVVAPVVLGLLGGVDNNIARLARVGRDEPHGLLNRPLDDWSTGCLVASELQLVDSGGRALISATPPPGTMPSSTAARVADSASSTRCFFSFSSVSVAAPTLMTATPPASLASRSCSFSRSKSEVVVSIWARICSMRPLIASSIAVALDEGGVVLGGDDAAGAAEILDRRAVELAADLLGDDRATGQDGDVCEHLLAAVAEARGLDGQDVERAAQLVDHQGRQRLAVDVLGDDHQVLAATWSDLLQQRAGCPGSAEIFLSVIRMYGSSSSASMRSGLVTK